MNSPADDSEVPPDLKHTRRRRTASAPVVHDRLPPQSPEAEQGVLGCIFLDPNACIPECERILGDKERFYDLRHQEIFGTVVEMFRNRKPIDIITLQSELKDRSLLESVGGLAYIATLPDTVPSASNLSYYLEIVREKFIRRTMIHTCTDAINQVYSGEGEAEELLDKVQGKLLGIGSSVKNGKVKTVKQYVHQAMANIQKRHEQVDFSVGLATHLPDFDRLTGGLQNDEMIVVAARPSMGKTSLAMNWVEYQAVDRGIPVGVISLEMTGEKLIERMVFCRADVDARKMTTERLDDGDFPALINAAGKIAAAPIHIVDERGLNILRVKSEIRRMFYQYGIKMFVLDYLQLVKGIGTEKHRSEVVANISHGVKDMCGELHIPGVVLCQLNRDIEKDKGRMPRLSDLRESGDIEQDADTVIMLHKDKEDDDANPFNNDPYDVTLVIAKRRNGPKGYVDAQFIPSRTRFVPRPKISEGDIQQELV